MKAHFVQAHRILWFNDLLDRVWQTAEQIGKEKGLPERAHQAIADALFKMKVRNASYRAFADVSENLASRDLKMLVDKRVLVPAGEKRGRYYQASPKLVEIGKKIFQPFRMDDEPFKSKPLQGVLPGI
jgi:Fic family protein